MHGGVKRAEPELRPTQGRVPPHNLDAEAAVLATLLLKPDEYDVVAGILSATHFYSDANRHIFGAIAALREAGAHIDSVTVAGWLKDHDRLLQVGGTPYLLQILGETPAVANVLSHAEIVLDKWTKRQLILKAQVVAAETYTSELDARSLVQSAEASFGELASLSVKSPMASVGVVALSEVDRLAQARKEGLTFTGVDTGFHRLNEKTAGLHNGDLLIIAGRPGMGKAQPLTAKVLTPSGFRLMGELAVGDPVTGADGKPYTVIGVHERGVREVFRVTVDDGGSTLCCAEHLWQTRTRHDRLAKLPGAARELQAIRATLRRAGGGANHSIPYVRPVEFGRSTELPLDPWLLGVYLGDGSSAGSPRIHNPEPDIQSRVAAALPPGDTCSIQRTDVCIRKRTHGAAHSETKVALQALGLAGLRSWEKFVPPEYLRASVKERTALLQGLCDTDGFVAEPNGSTVEYTTTSRRLRDDVVHLVGSLGGRVTWTARSGAYTKRGERHECRVSYRMVISFPLGDVVPVSSEKHLGRYKRGPMRLRERFIRSVEPAGTAACRCITVSAPDHLYVTDDYLVTHNSAFATNLAVNVARPRPERRRTAAVVFSLEMPKEQIALRIAAAERRIDFAAIRANRMSAEQWAELTTAAMDLSPMPLWIDDTPALSVLDLRARTKKLQRDIQAGRASVECDELGLVVVDYLQLMRGLREKTDTREREISSISQGLKQLAKELGVPVAALSQLNRRVETRGGAKEKRPQLSDLRESGAIEQDADSIWFLYREDYYDKEAPKGVAEIEIAKQRNGPTCTIEMQFDGPAMRFFERASYQDAAFEGEFEDDLRGM